MKGSLVANFSGRLRTYITNGVRASSSNLVAYGPIHLHKVWKNVSPNMVSLPRIFKGEA